MQADPATHETVHAVAVVAATAVASPGPISPFVPAGGVLLVVLAAGILLWALGGRLLRPGLALVGLIAGVPIGIWIGDAVAPEAPPVLFAGGGALAGLVIASISYRLALASATAVLAGVLALLGAWTAADMGLISDVRAAERIDAATDAARELGAAGAASAADVVEQAALEAAGASSTSPHARETLTRLWLAVSAQRERAAGTTESARGRGAAPASASTPASSTGSAATDASTTPGANDGVLARTRTAIEEIYASMPPPLRTLLMAALAAGAVAGGLFGFLFADAAARLVTSLAGSFLLLGAGVPLLSAVLGRSDDILPMRPGAWLAAVALLTIIGYGVQRMLLPPAGERGRAAPDGA